MDLVSSLFLNQIRNCEEVVIRLCKTLEVPVTIKTITKTLNDHPDYPSLLSISDTCSDFGIKNLSLQIKEYKKLLELPCPFLVQIKEEELKDDFFSIVYHLNAEYVVWFSPKKHKKERIPFHKFIKEFTGYVQLYEKDETAGEKNYVQNSHKEKQEIFLKNSLILAFPLLLCFIGVYSIVSHGLSASLFPIIYTIFLLCGSIMGIMILLYELNQYNPLLKKVCSRGHKTNCAAILQSKGSEIFGIRWSIIGISYFIGTLIVLMSGGIVNYPLLGIASWLNVLALPYTVYSVYYQAKVVKQWCPMCLTIQALLILLFIISILGDFFSMNFHISIAFLVQFIISMLIVFLASFILIPYMNKFKTTKIYQHDLQLLKYDINLFKALLARQKIVLESTEGLGITVGNLEGKIHLIKVCNPYCGACSMAHSEIDKLLESNSEIRLQIIFTSSALENDLSNRLVKTFLAISSGALDGDVRKALDEWYLSKKKDYEVFSAQYPIENEILKKQLPKIESMRNWCNKMEIAYTPTFFINNYQLPEIYTFQDLKYFLSV
jgi:uncharacterized membrane protein